VQSIIFVHLLHFIVIALHLGQLSVILIPPYNPHTSLYYSIYDWHGKNSYDTCPK
ncbi:uncharacterized protein METZ01_LOCUS113170, partial [marine metagenome]